MLVPCVGSVDLPTSLVDAGALASHPMRANQRLRRVLSLALMAIVLGACWLAVRNNLHDVRHTLEQLTWLDLVAIIGLGVVGAFAAYRSWRTVLSGLHADMPGPDARSMFFCSQVGKYLPGSVWPALIQTEIGARNRIPRPTVLLTYLFALVASLAAASATSIAILGNARSGWLVVVGVAMAIGGLGLVWLLVAPRGAQRFLRWVSTRRAIASDLTLTPRAGRQAFGYAVVAWWAMSLEAAWLAWRLAPHHPGTLTLLAVVGASTLSWTCGFLAIPVPAGAGVREAIFTFALAGTLGKPTAITIAVITRLVGVFIDLGAAAVSGLPSLVQTTRRNRTSAIAPAHGAGE